jgi:hypothetical protein
MPLLGQQNERGMSEDLASSPNGDVFAPRRRLIAVNISVKCVPRAQLGMAPTGRSAQLLLAYPARLARFRYSFRKASIGSSRDACEAGK